ncbi:MAG: hypothetical protein HYR56_17380 [Acidobacteria bacterium]|nr:hypothetical protein [Acidobacteriota bacterium]MBI3421851.1 hypothetical protein [Acidobacteriota bacterium]
MTTDPIIEELHQIRDQLAAKFNYDLQAIVADLQAQEKTEDRPVVSFAPQRIPVDEPAEVANSQRAA